MSIEITNRSFMATLTSGWRFTLPIALREAKGWEEGTRLIATAHGQVMTLEAMPDNRLDEDAVNSVEFGHAVSIGPAALPDADTAATAMEPPDSFASPGLSVEIYLGAGGKLIVPVPLRQILRWIPGKRLIVSDSEILTISPCCAATRCRSCGSTAGVREVLPNVHLCADCWSKYVMGVRQAARMSPLRRGVARAR